MMERSRGASFFRDTGAANWPILICLLGDFQLLKEGCAISVRGGGKTEALLCYLGVHYNQRVSRETLLNVLWSSGDPILAGQSLNSLVYSLSKLLGDAINGAAPILHADGYYQLNTDAGVGVDLACFEALVSEGDQRRRASDLAGAANAYQCAANVYCGDLWSGSDLQSAVDRERLRANYLSLLARLADYHYTQGDYAACLELARRLLAGDPCREDAHRLAMRCYVRQGERAQALRQYRLCADILRAEFDATPESDTKALYEQVRCDPSTV